MEFDYEKRVSLFKFSTIFTNIYKHTQIHTQMHMPLLAAVGLVSSSQSGSSCLLDNDHTCVQVCGEAHMGQGEVGLGGSVVSGIKLVVPHHNVTSILG